MNETTPSSAPEAISEATLQATLRDIRLPSEAAGGGLADVAAALALAALLALILSGAWRLAGRARSRAPKGLKAALADLPRDEGARRTALLHLLKAHAPERFAALRGGLYTPGGGPDAATLEAELRRHG